MYIGGLPLCLHYRQNVKNDKVDGFVGIYGDDGDLEIHIGFERKGKRFNVYLDPEEARNLGEKIIFISELAEKENAKGGN